MNTPEFDALINHITACAKCHAKHDIYCKTGRTLWIDDKAASIAQFDALKTRQYWLNDVKHNWPQYYVEIKNKIVEKFNAKLATNDK